MFALLRAPELLNLIPALNLSSQIGSPKVKHTGRTPVHHESPLGNDPTGLFRCSPILRNPVLTPSAFYKADYPGGAMIVLHYFQQILAIAITGSCIVPTLPDETTEVTSHNRWKGVIKSVEISSLDAARQPKLSLCPWFAMCKQQSLLWKENVDESPDSTDRWTNVSRR